MLHRVVTTKGKAEMGRYALESAAQIIEYYNDYFGTPYPLPKLDEIAVPGGFRRRDGELGRHHLLRVRLLFDPENSSSDTKQDIYEVIAHEIAHQWFGNLVTMAWWDNLWLNEGFASWMGSKCTAKFNPEWEVWLQRDAPRDPTRRAGIPKEAAMEGDARSTTHPIQQPIATEAEANSAFDDITYKKGQSFIRMLESFPRRRGLPRRHPQIHRAAQVFEHHHGRPLERARAKPRANRSAEIAANWTEQPGFPVVKVARDASGKITLTQERFTVNFPNAPAVEWKIPLTYSVAGSPTPVSVLMTAKTMELTDIPAGSRGEVQRRRRGKLPRPVRRRFLEAAHRRVAEAELPDRVNLLSDAWAFVQANRAPLSLYLELIEKLPTRTELAEREQIMTAFDYINRL